MSPSYEEIFYQALRIRMVEEKIRKIYPTNKIQSPVHLSIGQEHHISAIIMQLSKKDQVFTTYRSHAVYLAKGGNLKKMFAELYGKSTGISGGKAGSMHLCAPEVNMMGSSAIVGSTIPHSLGASYALKIKNKNEIAVSITGDGSIEEGVFYECLNFASLKQLPLFFVIENNGLAIHSHIKTRQSFDLKKLVNSYNIEYFKAEDGFDIASVSKKSQEIIKTIRDKKKPIMFEIMTYRYMQHVGINEDFDKGYRDRTEFEKWYKRDPLVTNEKLVEKYKDKIAREIEEAVEYAEKSPYPIRAELLKDVY